MQAIKTAIAHYLDIDRPLAPWEKFVSENTFEILIAWWMFSILVSFLILYCR